MKSILFNNYNGCNTWQLVSDDAQNTDVTLGKFGEANYQSVEEGTRGDKKILCKKFFQPVKLINDYKKNNRLKCDNPTAQKNFSSVIYPYSIISRL